MITLEQDFCRGFYTPFEEGTFLMFIQKASLTCL